MTSKVWSWCVEQTQLYECSQAALGLSALLIAITCRKLLRKKVLLPPGPFSLPIVGDLPFLDPQLHRCLAQLSLRYGPIMKIRLGSKLSIVFSSPEAAEQVLKAHDTNFSDRDVSAATVVGTYGASDMVFAPYGEHWRKMRKLCVSELLSQERLRSLYGLRREEVENMVNKVNSKVGSSIDIGEEVLVVVFNNMTSMMWGNTLDGEEKRRVSIKFKEALMRLVGLLAEPNFSDFFPMLSRFDLQGKERKVKEVLSWFDQIFEFVIAERRKMESQEEHGTVNINDKAGKDFLQVFLQLVDQRDDQTPITITHLKAFFMDMMMAGTKPTSTTVEWGMAELLNQPKLMKKAQNELEQVVGLNNVVEEAHLSKLPYLNAIVKETLRLHPVGPLLLPHRSREPCVINGYLIPKGAAIFVNAWAIQRNSEYWDELLEFKPERFVNSTLKWDYTGSDFRYIPFGSGRRICVGISLAEKLTSYILASLLHSFNWKLPDGTMLDLSEEFQVELKKKIPLLAIPMLKLSHSNLYD